MAQHKGTDLRLPYEETVTHNRGVLFDEAMARVEASGKDWESMPGSERDAVVQGIEQEWAKSDVPTPVRSRKAVEE